MSVLQEVLREEYARMQRLSSAVERELAQLPRGYVSRKVIRGKPAYYLQRREGAKVLSRYVPAEHVPQLQEQVARRRHLQARQRELRDEMRRLERAIR